LNIDLSNRVVIVTGAARGIGAQIARRFILEQARVVLLDRNADALKAAESSIRSSAADILVLECDVTNEDSVNSSMATIVDHFGAVDVLINNAGIAPEARIEQMSLADWEATFAANTRGVFLCTRAVIPHMKARQSGRILSASSFAAIIPSIGFAAYAASKAAVISFTRVLAAEVGPWSITANSFAPGMIPTPLNGFAEADAEKQTRLLNTLCIRRWGDANDIASLLIFLASDYASYITGASIEITGGKYAVQFPQLAHEQTL
jgi:3-oxoacyl-[acyl-carrier protein] reductase